MRKTLRHGDKSLVGGPVFCTFLAFVLRRVLQDRFAAAGVEVEWAGFVIRSRALPVQVERIDLKTGEMEIVRRIDFPGINGRLYGAAISQNGKTVVLTLLMNSSDLFVVDCLKRAAETYGLQATPTP